MNRTRLKLKHEPPTSVGGVVFEVIMLHLYDQIQAAVAVIRTKWQREPHAGIILGTGLGELCRADRSRGDVRLRRLAALSALHGDQPPRAAWCAACSAGVPVVVMEGRFHKYEGYPLEPSHAAGARDEGARRQATDRLPGGRRHEPALPAGRCDDHRRPHQPDGRQPAGRRERRPTWASAFPICRPHTIRS